jgi:hypothetical protein
VIVRRALRALFSYLVTFFAALLLGVSFFDDLDNFLNKFDFTLLLLLLLLLSVDLQTISFLN